MAKMTYAEIAEKLNKQYNKYNDNLQNAVTDAEKNSASLMLQRVSANLNKLILENQNAANVADSKNPPADSPNQSIANRTIQMAQYGGMMNADWFPMGEDPTIKSGRGLRVGPGAQKISIKSPRYFQEGGTVQKQFGGQTPPQSEEDLFYSDGTRKRIKVLIGGSRMAGTKAEERIIFADELPALTNGFTMRGGNFEVLGELTQEESKAMEKDLKEKKALQLETKSINDVNNMLSGLTPNVRNAMLEGYKNDPNYDIVNGKVVPKASNNNIGNNTGNEPPPHIGPRGPESREGDGNSKPTGEEIATSIANDKKPVKGRLYDGITVEQINPYKDEAGVLSGLGDKFDPTNSEHVKKLQEGLLGGYTGPGSDRMLSGTEGSYINKGGEFSVNNAGTDGRYGKDTHAALKQFSEMKPLISTGIKQQPIEVTADPLKVDLSALKTSLPVTGTPSEGGGDDGEGIPKGGAFADKIMGALPGVAKSLEYMKTANTINSMLPPPNLSLMRPEYINTKYDISPQLNALDQQSLLRERALTDSSTKANNVRTNLAAQDASFNNVRNQLYGDKFNKESALQNMQTAMNAKAADENRKTIFDNNMAQRDFINDRSLAQRDFMSGVVGDVMDLQTQKTNQASQMARLNALAPYLNMYGGYDRYLQNLATTLSPAQLKQMGLTTI